MSGIADLMTAQNQLSIDEQVLEYNKAHGGIRAVEASEKNVAEDKSVVDNISSGLGRTMRREGSR